MYYVYLIKLKDNHQYVGCTNNLRRRKDQHNEKARNKASKLGVFLNENNIVLKKEDLKIIARFDNRDEALKYERNYTINISKQNINLLNDNYSKECTRKGKRTNYVFKSKNYILIDVVNKTVTEVENLKKYCMENNLSYKSLNDTIKKVHIHKNQYKVFYKDEWENMSAEEQENYLSGNFLKEINKKIQENKKEKYSKIYEVMTPDNEKIIVKNLDDFARQHNLTCGTLHATLIKNNKHKGYKVIRRM